MVASAPSNSGWSRFVSTTHWRELLALRGAHRQRPSPRRACASARRGDLGSAACGFVCSCASSSPRCSPARAGAAATAARRSAPEFRNVVDLRAQDDGRVPRGRRRGEGQRLRARRDPHQPGHDGAVEERGSQPRTTSCPPTRRRTSARRSASTPTSSGPGDEYEFRFDAPGVYRYYCSLHGSKNEGMIGEIVVGDVDATGGTTATTGGRRARRDAARARTTTRRSRRRSTPRSRAASCSCRPASTRKRSPSRPRTS